jgi:hypothetical protein
MLSLSNFCKLKFNCFTFSNSSENIAILCTLLSKAIRFLPINFLFDNKTLIKSINKKVGTANSGKEFSEITENNKSRKIKEFKSKAETAIGL